MSGVLHKSFVEHDRFSTKIAALAVWHEIQNSGFKIESKIPGQFSVGEEGKIINGSDENSQILLSSNTRKFLSDSTLGCGAAVPGSIPVIPKTGGSLALRKNPRS